MNDHREVDFGRIRTLLLSHFYRKIEEVATKANVKVQSLSGDIYCESGSIQDHTLQNQKIGIWGTFRSMNDRSVGFELSVTHAQRWIPVVIVWIKGWRRARTFVVNRDVRQTVHEIENELLKLAERCAKLPEIVRIHCSLGILEFEKGDPRLQQLLQAIGNESFTMYPGDEI